MSSSFKVEKRGGEWCVVERNWRGVERQVRRCGDLGKRGAEEYARDLRADQVDDDDGYCDYDPENIYGPPSMRQSVEEDRQRKRGGAS